MRNCLEYKIFFLVFFSFFTFRSPCATYAQESGKAVGLNEILSISSSKNINKTLLHIRGVKPFISTTYELPNPKRIVVDLANVSISEKTRKNISLPFKFNIESVKGTDPTIVRLEIYPHEFDSFTSNHNSEELLITLNQNSVSSLSGENSSASNLIKYERQNDKDIISVDVGKKIAKYTTSETMADNKYALQIDIDDVEISDSLIGSKNAGGSLEKINIAKRGNGIRILAISKTNKPLTNSVKELETGLEVLLSDTQQLAIKNKNSGKSPSIANQLPEINPLESQISPQAREQQMQDAFNFSGYNKDRITVEFQKMDLHNVFNFLRQVSGVNIVVDESVQGSLTLVLDDVPWDFALDIILNLKNLEKEERFNTIVIYPKGKGFLWPEQAENNLSFEADKSVIEKESLVVQQQEKQSPDRIEAKQILMKAQATEKSEDYENAAVLYEQALEKWSDNTQIANKISAIYLGPLRQNAKSLYFSNKVLSIDPNNHLALLHGGIASANMQNYVEAERFFSQAISSAKPSKEAYLNYAAFKEERNKYSDSLSILGEHDRQYGKSIDSLLAAARVNDKAGNTGQAARCYRELLNSGYRMPPDLQKYVQERVAN